MLSQFIAKKGLAFFYFNLVTPLSYFFKALRLLTFSISVLLLRVTSLTKKSTSTLLFFHVFLRWFGIILYFKHSLSMVFAFSCVILSEVRSLISSHDLFSRWKVWLMLARTIPRSAVLPNR